MAKAKKAKVSTRKSTRKWNSLIHKGPLFAPDYKPLPSKIKLKYNGVRISLNPAAEEVAKFYAQLVDQEIARNRTLRKNFFMDFRTFMNLKERKIIQDLSKCDFSEIQAFILKEREAKKNLSQREKQKLKDQQAKVAETYGWCIVDKKTEKVSNFRVEPPGIFRGRGDHPLLGRIKLRVTPEDVTINCSKGKTPSPPRGHKWKEVIHDNSLAWLASWKDRLQNVTKYIWMNRGSKLHSKAEIEKFELALQLGRNIRRIRRRYTKDLQSKALIVRQISTVVYLIDNFGLRIGNEKGEDKADTVGCSTLRKNNIGFPKKKGNGRMYQISMDFIGKDSIEFHKLLPVNAVVWKNLKEFVKGKEKKDKIFDAISSKSVNDYLTELMPKLTAKVFRTYNSSLLFENSLRNLTPSRGSLQEKLDAFNEANLQVAQFCNHKKTVPKNFKDSLEKLNKKIKKLKEDLKKRQKDLKNLKKESKQQQKLRDRVEKLKASIKKWESTRDYKVKSKGIALQTSKQNYIDPRIIVAWCKSHGVPVEKVYNKTLREKFRWAESTDEDFVFEA